MKIYGKQVLIGSKKICVEYTSKIVGGFEDCHIGYRDFKGEDLETDMIFIKDKKGYLLDIRDISGSGFFSLNCYGACPRYKSEPKHAGDLYIGDLKPYMNVEDQETIYDLKDFLKSLKHDNCLTV